MNSPPRCASPDNALEPLSFQEIGAYLGRKYSGAAMRKMHETEAGSLSRAQMDRQCRVAITIPALHTERALRRTLSLYADQTARDEGVQFEIDVLVNGPADADLENSPAFNDAFDAAATSPVPISVFTSQYPAQERQIGRIRRDLGALTLRRALYAGHEDPGELVLVTNDADARAIAPGYVSAIAGAFSSDPRLAGATGFIDLPREDFEHDHVLLATHRVSQALEIIYRAKHPNHPMTMRGGSSMFRMRDYVRAGGHGTARISEHRHLNLALNRTPGLNLALLPRRVTTIVTDARRQIATMAAGKPVSASYAKFGLPGDVAEKYHGTERFQASSPRVEEPEFPAALTGEFQAMVNKFTFLHESMSWEHVRGWFERAAFFAGIRVTFDGQRVTITDTDVLRDNILARYASAEDTDCEVRRSGRDLEHSASSAHGDSGGLKEALFLA